jgi:hypothetical protein
MKLERWKERALVSFNLEKIRKTNLDTMHFSEFHYFHAMLDTSRLEELPRLFFDKSMKETYHTTNSHSCLFVVPQEQVYKPH